MATLSSFLLDSYYSGTITAKLAAARELHARRGPALLAAPVLAQSLVLLRREAELLNQTMRAMDLNQLCRQCAARPGGGCCSAYMADNVDAILLLINLLLGAEVQCRTDSGEDCCFLGETGCQFLVKPIFCLNYNCTHILDSLTADRLQQLYHRAAALLSQQTRVESLLLEGLRPDPPSADKANLAAAAAST